MHAYIINLEGATERWEFVSKHFLETGIDFTRVSGIRGSQLSFPHPQYCDSKFKWRHGHHINLGAVGCYLSHLKCLQLFLESSHEYAIIAEDDAQPVANLREIVGSAIDHQSTWDLVRLCGFHNPHAQPYATLFGEYKLCVCLTRLCGTGAYLLSRQAAEILIQKLDPMVLPIDHAIDREWVYGLRAAAIIPLPVSQRTNTFESQCSEKRDNKFPWYQRYCTVFPYRAWNEASRFVYRGRQLVACKYANSKS